MTSARSSGFLMPAKAILVPGAQLLRIGQVGVERRVVPGALLLGQRARVAEALVRGDGAADHAPQRRTDLVRTALLEAVAGRADPHCLLPLFGARAGQERGQARGRGCIAALGCRSSLLGRGLAGCSDLGRRRGGLLGRNLGQRRRAVRQRAQIEDHVGAVLRRKAGERHLGAGRPLLGIGQERAQALVVPGALLRDEGIGIGEALVRGDVAPEHAPQRRTDLVRRRPARSCGRPGISGRPSDLPRRCLRPARPPGSPPAPRRPPPWDPRSPRPRSGRRPPRGRSAGR